MGRKAKRGLEAFLIDAATLSDESIKRLIWCQGGKAVSVYTLLLGGICQKGGYYMRWTEQELAEYSGLLGFSGAYVAEVVKSCSTLGLFHAGLYRHSHVLTSARIQQNYVRLCRLMRRTPCIDEYNLLSTEAHNKTHNAPAIPTTPTKPTLPTAPTIPTTPASPATVPTLDTELPFANPAYPLTLDEEIVELKKADVWLDNLQCLHHMTKDQLRSRLDDFRRECLANGKGPHNCLSDAKAHYNSWLRITKQHSNASNITQQATQRRGYLLPADAEKTKDYGGSF